MASPWRCQADHQEHNLSPCRRAASVWINHPSQLEVNQFDSCVTQITRLPPEWRCKWCRDRNKPGPALTLFIYLVQLTFYLINTSYNKKTRIWARALMENRSKHSLATSLGTLDAEAERCLVLLFSPVHWLLRQNIRNTVQYIIHSEINSNGPIRPCGRGLMWWWMSFKLITCLWLVGGLSRRYRGILFSGSEWNPAVL